jgi:hypothetical protein
MEGFDTIMSSPSNDSDTRKSWLIDQLTKSEFFHQKLHEYGLLEIAYVIESIQGQKLNWSLETLGISQKAWESVIHQGIKPIRVFAHPCILVTIDRSVGYYRGLAMVSLKSMSNIQLSIERYETGKNKRPLDENKAWAVARHLNELISRLIEMDEQIDSRELDIWRGMTAGSTAQGSWQNRKGDVAEDLVKGFIRRRIRNRREQTLRSPDDETQILKDGRTVEYASEPDLAFYDKHHKIIAAVEIKGGIDQAGVLERVGAAIKSLSRAKQENPDAITILIMYKVAMTYQTMKELEIHQDSIDYHFTIEDVLNHDDVRQEVFKLLHI